MDTLNGRWIGRNYFLRHFLEMLVAMIVEMAVLGMAVSSIFALLGHTNLYDYAGLRAVLMASYMTVGMALWMRHRGHGWPTIREMSAAMFAPFLLLMVPFWAGLISGGALLAGGHLLTANHAGRNALSSRGILPGSPTLSSRTANKASRRSPHACLAVR